jgi:hypothetical protein
MIQERMMIDEAPQKIPLHWDTFGSQQVLVYDFQEGWTWKDFFDVKQVADRLLAELTAPVPLIFDLRGAPDLPPGMLTNTRAITETRHPNGTPVILVGASTIVQTTYDIVRRMLGERASLHTGDVVAIKTWDEAIQIVKERHS